MYTIGCDHGGKRQKRKPGDPDDQGNDFVLRVAGNDVLSARISRRHCEIVRTEDGFAITDHSKTGVTRNGGQISKETAVDICDGDLLGIAGVVMLEVSLRPEEKRELFKHSPVVEIPAPSGVGGGQIQMEASLGDVATMGD